MILDVRTLEAGASVEEFAGAVVRLWVLRLVLPIQVLCTLVAGVGPSTPVTLGHLFDGVIEVCVGEHGSLARVYLFLVPIVVLR